MGEAEVLTVARSRGALAVLDEKAGRAVAVGLGIRHVGTVGVLLEAFLGGSLTYQQLVEAFEALGKVAWVSPQLLARVLRQAKEV